MSPMVGRGFELVGAILSIVAGVCLLERQGAPVAVGQSWFEVLARGIGMYFLGRGAWMLDQLGRQRATVDALRQLVAQSGWRDEDEE